MCPPARVTPPDNIGLYWTDEEVFTCLERMIQGESSVPANVIKNINPYQQLPSNLNDEKWYFIHSEQKKDSEYGFWKAKGDANAIYTGSSIIGWRTTLEFYKGQALHGQRTDWVMQEYRIPQKGLCSNNPPKESSLLCRIFLSSGTSPNHETQHKLGGAAIAGGTTGQGCMSESQARNKDDYTGPLAAAGELPHSFVENMVDDFLELDDLLGEPELRCSSLDNTSCLPLTSDEYFDSWALMQELEDEIDRNKQQQGKNANFKFCIAAASGKPNKVVMHPATLGSLISINGSKLPAEAVNKKLPDRRIPERVIKIEKTHDGKEGTSKSPTVVTSSSGSPKAVTEGEKKAQAGVTKKLKKDYLRFMPF